MKGIKYFLIIALQLFMLCNTSCTYQIDELPSPSNPTPSIDSCSLATITYNNYVKGLLDSKCNSIYCHGGGAPGNFTNYSATNFYVKSGIFQKRVFDGTPSYMPPGNSLPQQQVDSLLNWINQGACE